jgi:glutathione synthase/RimK-type ligase-like ATP-grasp enzyme
MSTERPTRVSLVGRSCFKSPNLSLLIFSSEQDAHAQAVCAALQDHRVDMVRLSGADFPVRDTISIRLSTTEQSVMLEAEGGGVVDLSGVTTVWRRRNEYPSINTSLIHPDDRKFAYQEAEAGANGLRDVSALVNGAVWINPRQSAVLAQNKPYQLAQAIKTDLNIPKTLISNSPSDVRAFFRALPKGAIYKPLTPAVWEDENDVLVYFVEPLDEEALSDSDIVRATPGIYQETIEKAFELRVTIMDRFVHAVKVDSQALAAAQTDWRQHIHDLKVEHYQLPSYVETKLLKFMELMGLRFGAVDLIVTPQGDYVFLEVNEMGQFLWIEQSAPEERLLAHFCAYLCCTDRPYAGELGRFEGLRFSEYEGRRTATGSQSSSGGSGLSF